MRSLDGGAAIPLTINVFSLLYHKFTRHFRGNFQIQLCEIEMITTFE